MFMMKIGDIGSLSILNKEYGVVSNVLNEYKNHICTYYRISNEIFNWYYVFKIFNKQE